MEGLSTTTAPGIERISAMEAILLGPIANKTEPLSRQSLILVEYE